MDSINYTNLQCPLQSVDSLNIKETTRGDRMGVYSLTIAEGAFTVNGGLYNMAADNGNVMDVILTMHS